MQENNGALPDALPAHWRAGTLEFLSLLWGIYPGTLTRINKLDPARMRLDSQCGRFLCYVRR